MDEIRRFRIRVRAVLLLICITLPVFSIGTAAAQQVRAIQISVMALSATSFSLQSPRPIQIVVQVRDDDDNPIPGVILVFSLPAAGASALFAGGAQMVTATTAADGTATVVVQQSNGVEGEYVVRVDASYQGLTDTLNIQLSNVRIVPPVADRFPMKWVIAGAIGAGVASAAAVRDDSPVPGGPDLTITQTPAPMTFVRGSTGSFTSTVVNSGSTATSGTVTVTSTFPPGLTPTAASATGWTCFISGQLASCRRSDTLNSGASYPVMTVTVGVAANAGTPLTVITNVSSGSDAATGNSSATLIVNTVPASVPDLTIAIAPNPASFTRGSVGVLTFTVSNTGGSATSGLVTVSDTFPAGLTPTTPVNAPGWSCSVATQTVTCTRADALNAGAAYPGIAVTLNVAPGAAATLTTTAAVSGGGDASTGNNSATSTVNTAAADLTIAIAPNPASFTRGSTGVLSFTVSNTGGAATSGLVTVSDTFPAGLTPTTAVNAPGWSCSVAAQTMTCARPDALNAGAAYPGIAVTLNVAAGAAATLTTTVTVSGGGDAATGNNSATSTVNTVAAPQNLTIAITPNPASFTRGSTGILSFTVSNTGGSATSGPVTVTGTFPAGLTPTTPEDAPGWSCNVATQALTCTRPDALNAGAAYPGIAVTLIVSAQAAATLTTTAAVGGGGDASTGNNSATLTVNTVAPLQNLTIAITPNPATFVRGSTGILTLTVSNTGGSPTSGPVVVIDTFPAGLTMSPAPAVNAPGWSCDVAGQTLTCTRSDVLNAGAAYPGIAVTLTVAPTAAATLTTTATASGGGDATPATSPVAIVNTLAPADLTISQTRAPTTFIWFSAGTITLTVTNTAGGVATNGTVTVTDTFTSELTPVAVSATGWTCSISGQLLSCGRADALNAGAGYPAITVTVRIAITTQDTRELTNTAAVSGGGDTTPGNNSSTATIPVAFPVFPPVDLTKEIGQPIVAPGDAVGFRLGMSNLADFPLTDVALNDTLPAGFAYEAGSARIHITGPSGEDAAGQAIAPTITPDGLTFPIGTLPAGSRVAIRYETLVTAKARPGELVSRLVGIASSLSGERLSTTPAEVRVVVTAGAFTLNQVLIGRVFEDNNQNGSYDNSEPGVANVRVVNSSGQSATTDSYGQYNLPSLAAGSVLVAVDPSTLPPGFDLPSNATRLGGAGQLLRTPLDGGALLRQNFALRRVSPASTSPASTAPAITGNHEAGYGGQTARLEVIVERPIMSAGAHDKQWIRIRALDNADHPAANTAIVVTTLTGAVMEASTASDRLACESVLSLEERPDRSRQVVLETDGGEAAVCLISDVVPGTTRLTASAGGDASLRAMADVRFETAEHPPMLIAVGELGIGLSGPGAEATEGAKRIDGQASIFYQDSLTERDRITLAVRSKQGVNRATGNTGLFEFDPAQRLYPVMGDASTRQEMAQSASRVYARYDRGQSYVMYGDLQGDTTAEGRSSLLEYNRNVTGLRFRFQRENATNWLQAQAAHPKTAYMREVSSALAGTAIRLSRSPIVQGSETVTLEVRDRRNPERIISRETLIRNVDYALDPLTGALFMMRSIGLFDPSLNLVQLVSTYEYETSGVESAMYLARGAYSIKELGLSFGVSALTQNEGGLHFAVGGLELEKRLPNGGRFKAEMPLSHGRLQSAGTCCEAGRARNGIAIRAEFEQPMGFRNTILRGQFGRIDEGFFNPYGSITASGQQFRQVSVETRGFESSRLNFSAGKEVNRNSAADNERETFSAKLSQTLRENLWAEAGIDRREFKDRKSDQQIDSHLISAGLRWSPLSRLETSVVREQNVGEADPTYPSQTLLGAQFKLNSWSRLFATQRFSSAAIVPISGVESSGVLSPLSMRETAIGVESRVGRNTSMTTRYRMDSGANGSDSFAVLGMLTRMPVRPGLSIDLTLDNALHLAGNGKGYIGGSFGFSQSKGDNLRISARYELRRRGISENIITAGVVGRLTDSMSALARFRSTSFGIETASRINDGQLALSVRPRQSDRVALLFSYDYGSGSPTMIAPGTASGLADRGQTNRLSADGLLEVGRGLEIYGRAASARIPGRYGGSRQATYLQGRLQQSVFDRFDIAGEARWIQEASNIAGALVTGVEWGTWLTRDFRIGVGYSPKGFANPGALLNSTAARGGAYFVISSRLSSIFDFMGGSNKTQAAQASTAKSAPRQ